MPPPIFLLLPNDFAPFPLSFFLTFLWFPFAIQSAIRSTNRHASLVFRLGHALERAVPETQKWRRSGLVLLPRTTEFPKQSVRITFIWSGASGRAKAFHPNRAKATGHDSFDGPRLAGGAEPVWSLVPSFQPFIPAPEIVRVGFLVVSLLCNGDVTAQSRPRGFPPSFGVWRLLCAPVPPVPCLGTPHIEEKSDDAELD